MRLFDRAVVRVLPAVPRSVVRRVAAPYIAGEKLDDAIRVVEELNAAGASATVDVAKMYAGALSCAADEGALVIAAMTSTNAKYNKPSGATGIPRKLPYGLRYASVQLTVELTSQKLVYEGSVSRR